jgi:type IV pilus assembly protein PilX
MRSFGIMPILFVTWRGRQTGAALVVSLLLLLVATLIGVTAMQVTSLEEKMAGNLRDRNLAFQAAESALRAGEAFLRTQTGEFVCGTGHYRDNDAVCPPPVREWVSFACTAVNSVEYTGGTLSGLAANPRYAIDEINYVCEPSGSELGAGSEKCYFRITACGFGGTMNAMVILQSTYQR